MLNIDIDGDDPPDLMVNYLRELLYQWSGKEKLIKKVDILTVSYKILSARIHTENYIHHDRPF